ncbi:hypothetical protein WAI453_010032 [Rhynchosporium graminicola]
MLLNANPLVNCGRLPVGHERPNASLELLHLGYHFYCLFISASAEVSNLSICLVLLTAGGVHLDFAA